MALTVIVLSAGGPKLTFDGTQRVAIGRGSGCDVRLPDATVSHRHATLQAQGADFVVVDEGSTNGTFVGSVRVAGRTSRIVRSGDRIRVGRVWLELRVDQSLITRDLAAATRDIALALVSRALDEAGADSVTKVKVVEGLDQGVELTLADEGSPYVVGRAPPCALALADPDVSREHAEITRRGGAVYVTDRGAKNGTWIGEVRIGGGQEVPWRQPQMVRVGRSVLALMEPLASALLAIESAPDEVVGTQDEQVVPYARPAAESPAPESPAVEEARRSREATEVEATASAHTTGRARRRGWSLVDLMVMGAALCILGLSLAGLVWLLRG
jgi:pSer/pThr/pTyr-binding forkhead associated (FHA) protein